MRDKTPFLLISNCQVQPLKHGLSEVCNNVEIDSFAVHVVPVEERDTAIKQLVQKKNFYKFVVSIPLSDDFGMLSSENIAVSFHPTPVISISNITFRGLQPDITYVGGMSARAPGPIGDYHSKIALLGYLMGLSIPDTLKLYCNSVYEALGFYAEFEESSQELKRRDENTTIPLGDDLEASVQKGVAFLSHNHPTSLLLAPYVNKIAAWLAENNLVTLTGLQLRPEEMINFLACSSVFPVYPEIANYHKLPFEGSYVFRTATLGDLPSKPIGLGEFVEKEFEAFGYADRDFLVSSYPGNILMFRFGDNEDFMKMVRAL